MLNMGPPLCETLAGECWGESHSTISPLLVRILLSSERVPAGMFAGSTAKMFDVMSS